jgi:hypothetical protein
MTIITGVEDMRGRAVDETAAIKDAGAKRDRRERGDVHK